MPVTRIGVLGFRNLVHQELEPAEGITLLWGPNGAGKTNVLEALCVALAGRSCRTRKHREAIAFGESLARVEVQLRDGPETREMLWSLSQAGERRHLVDGNEVAAEHAELRPALAVFLPDRLALVKGPPGVRRAHLDRLCAALWPARAESRRRYSRALAQRNALLARTRVGGASRESLDAWEWELASAGVELAAARRDAVAALVPEFTTCAAELGLAGEPELRYVPRSDAADAAELAAELRSRREMDLARGHTTHGPHLDDLALSAGGRPLRRYGSQGEQRAALLALLFAERRAFLAARRAPPLMLLDDVMSELDAERRQRLARRLAVGGGQAVLTATEPSQLPIDCERTELAMERGEVNAVRTPNAEATVEAAGAVLAA
jgi:DNA replication and repair protein RecF